MPDDLSNAWDASAAWDELADNDTLPAPAEPRGEGVIPLGHDRGIYYYFSVSAGQVYDLTPAQHSRASLSAMASVPHHWERSRFMNDKRGVLWEEAGASLMASCREVGIYNPDRVRGRGAWLDDGRTVLHVGDRLIVDGHDTGSCQLDGTTFIYEQGRRLHVRVAAEPLDNRAASRLMDLCMAPAWQDQQSMGRLLAGWLVVAPICGAMPWRPHLWVTSEGGGGKSWIMDNIIRPIVSDVAARFQSKTTEAGVRQTLGTDARPVLFDEFEAENDRDRERVQQILDLARQASSEDGAGIIKGGQDGRARMYHIRSMFAFCSINLNLGRSADESRTVVLTLVPSTDANARNEQFAKLKELHASVLTADFPAALLARTLRLLPVIRHNAEVFAQAISRAGQSRRLGDTIGVLLAGAWSLRSTRAATPHEADAFISGTPWVTSAMTRNETMPEWQRALSFLAQQTLRVVPSNNRPEDVPIGELLVIAAALPAHTASVPIDEAAKVLARAGLKVIGFGVTAILLIANTSQTLAMLFKGSSLGETGWLPTLSRAPGAFKENKTKAFATHRSKALSLPLSLVVSGEDTS